MEKLYNRIDFHNGTVPALNDANLNAMSKAIDDLDNRIINLPVVITEESIEKAEAAAERAEEVLESIPSDYSALSAEVQTKADKTQLSSRNLLDNGWFTVNQRGANGSIGASTYCLDRWKAMPYASATKCGNGYIEGTSVTDAFAQFFDDVDMLVGKTFTVSILVDGEIHNTTISNYVDKNTYIQLSLDDVARLYIGTITGWGQTRPCFAIAPLGKRINAVKIELGSISTLANDTAPNYAEELLKCQRYYYRLRSAIGRMYGVNTKAWMTVELPVQMAKVPTLVLHPTNLNVYANGQTTDGNVTSLGSDIYMNDNQLRFFINFNSMGAGASWFTPIIMQAESQYGYIEVSADL